MYDSTVIQDKLKLVSFFQANNNYLLNRRKIRRSELKMNFNENYHLDGHELTALFDKTLQAISFADPVRQHILNSGSIIYSVWDKNGSFIYIGIAGTQKAFEKRSPLRRMQTHASGRRSGDQFNIYVHDFYVIPDLIESGVFHYGKGILDKLTNRVYTKEPFISVCSLSI